MSDLLFQQLSTVQNDQQLGPATKAAATTVAPSTFITYVTGTTNIATVTPPVSGSCMLVFVFTDASPGDFVTTGNVPLGLTTITQNAPILLFYNPLEETGFTMS